jgi:hypothetical protein
MLPPEPRLPGARELVAQQRYFVVHAPRQTGKTTTLNALARDLTAEGKHVALRFSCERAAPTGDDYGAAGGAILEAITEAAQAQGVPTAQMPPSPWPEPSAASRLKAGLTAWARSCPLPIVLFFDEIDALRGQSLVSVLRQLRDGYTAEEFAAFWRERGEILAKGKVYHEVAPQLVFIAFLQRIVNGWCPCDKLSVDCEYGIGRGRIDVLVRKPSPIPATSPLFSGKPLS